MPMPTTAKKQFEQKNSTNYTNLKTEVNIQQTQKIAPQKPNFMNAIQNKYTKVKTAQKGWGTVGKRVNDVGKLGVRFYGSNFHDNFKDLNPSWAQKKHQRAVEKANEITADIGRSLKPEYKRRHISLWTATLEDGNRLNLDQVKSLDEEYWLIYKGVINKDHDNIMEDLNKQREEVTEVQDQVVATAQDLIDLKEEVRQKDQDLTEAAQNVQSNP